MVEFIKSETFDQWLKELGDLRAVARVQARLNRMAAGNPGDVKSVGDRVSEIRIDYGPGYRIYFTRRGSLIVILLCGGDKSTQEKDIARAKKMAADWED